ncbi:MAG: helix-turn-helix domain-containing protein [Planctomycetota bacterium]
MHEHIHLPDGRNGHLWYHRPQGHLHHWHHHDPPEFNLVLRGRGTYLLADRRYELDAHCLVWLFPGQEHRLVDMSRDFRMWIAIIDPAVLEAAAPTGRTLLERDPAGCFARRLATADSDLIDRICSDLAVADQACFNTGLPYCFLSAWSAFGRADPARARRLHPAIETALRLLDRDPELAADGLATAVGLSRAHCCRLFREQVGQTLTAYRTRLRLEGVRTRLQRQPHRALLPLALEAGFGSYAQFYRAVRMHWRCSPRELVDADRAAKPPGPAG